MPGPVSSVPGAYNQDEIRNSIHDDQKIDKLLYGLARSKRLKIQKNNLTIIHTRLG
jgi:hypothetical protein